LALLYSEQTRLGPELQANALALAIARRRVKGQMHEAQLAAAAPALETMRQMAVLFGAQVAAVQHLPSGFNSVFPIGEQPWRTLPSEAGTLARELERVLGQKV
jgi:hypothetical protein